MTALIDSSQANHDDALVEEGESRSAQECDASPSIEAFPHETTNSECSSDQKVPELDRRPMLVRQRIESETVETRAP